MINFIKANWLNLIGIAACILATIALDVIVITMTRGCYNLIDFLFM